MKIYYISMSISQKFNFIPYKVNKMIDMIYLPKMNVNKQKVWFRFMRLL